ncbi:MAG: SDR family oxidoreductase [Burkholderiales bacterium]|nr:SDR family oxidoreductase [Burkholderiales bacterium]
MSNKTIFITGASRGVGLEIAKRFAKDGCNIAFVAKTVEAHPKLKGTIDTAKAEILAAGANDVTAIQCNVCDLEELKKAIDLVGQKYGKIDVLVNNASSIYLVKTQDLTEKSYTLMHQIIVQSSLFATKYALPYLEKSTNAHILNIAPKPDLKPKWFANHTAYTLCKFTSGMMVMGHAAELAPKKIAVNGLWPATLLDTAAVQNLLGGEAAVAKSRKPSIMADAAHYITNQDCATFTGNYFLDEELIVKSGAKLDSYSVIDGSELITDLYVEPSTRIK